MSADRLHMRRYPLALVIGLLSLGLAGCPPANPSFPDRILDPEVMGVVVENRDLPDSAGHIYVMDDGAEVELRDPAIQLEGPGPGGDRLLVVARDGDSTYYLFVTRDERLSSVGECFLVYPTAAWETPEGLVFRFSGANLGLRFPAEGDYSPDGVNPETGFIRSEQAFCASSDGVVHDASG